GSKISLGSASGKGRGASSKFIREMMGSVVEQAERESGCGGRLPHFSPSAVESGAESVAHSDGASDFKGA
ncbi:MAG: hypothetical protein ORN83_13550, partial [Chthoniobacteraceae bacterium]|nr:hypothetical protein [Chthoniobacteraceae bacterium]